MATDIIRWPARWRRRFISPPAIRPSFQSRSAKGLRPWSPLKVYARVPAFQITSEGMYDYAIDKFVPVRFFDYVNQTWSETRPSTNLRNSGRRGGPGGRTHISANRARGLGLSADPERRRSHPAARSICERLIIVTARASRPAEHENSFFDGIDVSLNGIADLSPRVTTKFLKDGLARISRIRRGCAEGSMRPTGRPRSRRRSADGLKATRALGR